MDNIKLEEVVGLFSNTPAEFIATLKGEDGEFKPNAMDLLKEGHKSFMKKTVEGKEGKAVRLRMTSLEKKISPLLQKYEVQKSDTLEETLNTLVEKIGSKAAPEGGGGKKELTEDEIKALPVFKNALQAGVKAGIEKSSGELNTKYSTLEKQYKGLLSEREAEKIAAISFKETERALIKAKVALPDKKKDPDAYNAKIQSVATLVKANHQTKAVDGKLILVGPDGEQLEDGETYQPIHYADIAAKTGTSLFGVDNYDPGKGGAGAQNKTPNGNQTAKKWTGKVPSSDAEYMDAMLNTKTAEERASLEAAYTATKAATANQ